VRIDQVVGLLNYDIVPIDIPRTIGAMKGIVENPFVKIEMTKSNAFLVMTFGEYIDIKRKGRATQLYKPEVAVGKKKRKTLEKSQSSEESEEDEDIEDEEDGKNEDEEDDEEENKQKQKKQKTGHESYLEYLDTGNFKNMPSKMKRTKFLPDDDDEPIVLSPGTLEVVNLTISPIKVKVEKMGKEMVVSKKEQKQTNENFKRIKQEIGAQIGEFFKMYLDKKLPVEKPEQEKKDEDEKDKNEN